MTRRRGLLACILLSALTACASNEQQRAIYIIEDSGDFAYEKGDYVTAVNEYREVVERRPGKLSARVNLAKAYLASGDADLAVEHFGAAYTIDPSNDEVVELFANAMLEKGDTEELTRFLRQEANSQNSVSSWMRLGKYLGLAGDDDEAERSLLEAARLDAGTSVQPQLELARFYQGVGDVAKATRRYRMALYVDPSNPFARGELRALGHIPGPTFALEPDER